MLNVMDGNSFKVIETHAARSWDAAKKSGNRIVMKKGNENIYVRVYDDNDHSNVIFITREKVKRLRKKIVGEFDDN